MYKGKYIIGIYTYDRYELCEAILENAIEFADYVGIPVHTARSILSHIFNHWTNYILVDGRRKKVEFIDTTESEEYNIDERNTL